LGRLRRDPLMSLLVIFGYLVLAPLIESPRTGSRWRQGQTFLCHSLIRSTVIGGQNNVLVLQSIFCVRMDIRTGDGSPMVNNSSAW
jgi:hypothetical protein